MTKYAKLFFLNWDKTECLSIKTENKFGTESFFVVLILNKVKCKTNETIEQFMCCLAGICIFHLFLTEEETVRCIGSNLKTYMPFSPPTLFQNRVGESPFVQNKLKIHSQFPLQENILCHKEQFDLMGQIEEPGSISWVKNVFNHSKV